MNSPFKKIGISMIAVAIFVGIMLMLSFYFFHSIGKNRQAVEKQGFRALNQLGLAMKTHDIVIRKMLENNVAGLYIPDTVNGIPGRKDVSTNVLRTSPLTRNMSYRPFSMTDSLNSPDILNYSLTGIITSSLSLKDFITPILRKNFFSDYLLIRNNQIAFSTLSADLYISQKDGEESKNIASLLLRENICEDSSYSNLIHGGFIEKVKVHGIVYDLFLIPVKFHENDKESWFLGGLIKEKTVASWERDLPPTWIIIFIIILFFIVFSFPILRVLIAGPNERITKSLVTLVGFSLVAGTLLIVVLATELLIERTIRKGTQDNLENLNGKILNEFSKERTKILSQLSTYDSIGRPNIVTKKPSKDSIESLMNHPDTIYYPEYRYFKTMFWADANGDQQFYITPLINNFKSNVGYRSYFKTPDKYLDIRGDTLNWYMMEPIYSNTSGEWVLAFSKPAAKKDSAKIIAMTSWMYSLKSPVLQDDYEYFLVDKSGSIWYHSKEIFNLTDNLKIECDNDNLNTLMNSNSTGFMNITLRNREYDIYIAPVAQTDLFLITMFNPDRVRSMEATSSSFTIGYFTLILLLLTIIYFLWRLATSNNLIQKENSFFHTWLIPKKKNLETYGHLFCLNMFISLVMLIVVVSGIIRNIPFTGVFWGLLLLIILNCIFNTLLLIQIPLTIHVNKGLFNKTLNALDKRLNRVRNFLDKDVLKHIFKSDDYLKRYTAFLSSWLIVGVIFPSITLMVRFHNEETKLYICDQFQGVAHKLNQRTDSLSNYYRKNIQLPLKDSLLMNRDTMGLYFKVIWDSKITRDFNEKEKARYANDRIMFPRVHSIFNRLIGDAAPFNIDPLIEGSAGISKKTIGLVFDKLVVNYPGMDRKDSIQPVKTVRKQKIYTALKGGLQTFSLFERSVTTIIFIGVITFLVLLIMVLLRKIVLKLYVYKGLLDPPLPVRAHLKPLAKSDRNAIIITLDDNFDKELHGMNWEIFDMSDGASTFPTHPKKYILRNFHVNVQTLEEFEKRIVKLDRFLKSAPIVLILDRTPLQLVDSILEIWKFPNDNVQQQVKLKELIEYFRKTIFNLPVLYGIPEIIDLSEFKFPPALASILKKEKNINQELLRCKHLLMTSFQTCYTSHSSGKCKNSCNVLACNQQEEILLKIEELSLANYTYIWSLLSHEEHFILYDMAKGHLLNLKNQSTISSLFCKGILTRNEQDEIEIESSAFRNFILSSVDVTDIEMLATQSAKAGNWNRLRLPGILIAASIIVFLFATQQSVLSNLNAIMLSVATLLGVYLKFSGLFVPGNK